MLRALVTPGTSFWRLSLLLSYLRDDVVILTLGRVKDVLLLHARRSKLLKNILEHPSARLVHPHLVAGDPLLERILHGRAHVPERPRVGVRHSHEPVPGFELFECLYRVRERRPRADGVSESLCVFIAGFYAPPRR